MTFEIPFNVKKSLEQYKIVLKLRFKKPINTSIKNLLASGGLVFFGWLALADKSNKSQVGYFFLALGFFYLFNVIQYFMYYMRMAKKLKRGYQGVVERRDKKRDISIWEFDDVFFRYKDMYYDHTVQWAAFAGYRVIDKNLFLSLREGIDQSYIISEDELAIEPFAAVLAFLEGRIKNLEPDA